MLATVTFSAMLAIDLVMGSATRVFSEQKTHFVVAGKTESGTALFDHK